MNGRKRERTRVLVQLDFRQSAGRAAIGGILRYAATHPDWDLQILDGHPANAPIRDFLSWEPAAIVIDSPLDVRSVGQFRAHGLRALASFHREDYPDLGIGIVHAGCDHRQIVRTGADFLLRKGITNFAFVPSPLDDDELRERETAFVRYLSSKGFCVSVFRGTGRSMRKWAEEIKSLSEWIQGLPKPCGIMAAFDQRAKHIIDACRLSDLLIPDQVQVLGVDNEEIICEQTVPSLTSVMPDFEDLGYRAAAELDRLLQRGGRGQVRIRSKVRGIVERSSTDDYRGSSRCVSLAREFIRLHAASGITVADVVAASHTGERILQRHFRDICGRSIRDELIDTRLSLVKDRLRSTRIPIDRIGDLCGFRDAKNLKALFRRRFGMTMTAFRTASGQTSKA